MTDDLNARDIVVLSGLEAVRKNPWMYIGSVSDAGAQHLLHELVFNSVDEALAGACTRVAVTLGAEVCRADDDGRGIPTEILAAEGLPACEVVLTKLHSGSKFSRETNRFSSGLHGVGLSCVNALSERLKVEIRRNGKVHVQEFRRGEPLSPLRTSGETTARGTTIEFRPDPEIFRTFTGYRAEDCRRFLEELSFLNPGVEFVLNDARDGGTASFRTESGIAGLLAHLNPKSHPLIPAPISIRLEGESLFFEAVLLWTADREASIASYANGVATVHGGTHVSAFRAGLTRAVNRIMTETGKRGGADDRTEVDEATEGLAAVVNLKLAHPNFEGQTKSRLTNADIVDAVESATHDQILAYLRANPRAAAIIADKILQTRSARLAARRVAEKIYFQNAGREIDEEVYKEQFGARSKNWHESAVWITHAELLKTHAGLCKQGKDATVLDVCCGSGVVGASFKGRVKKVIGLDLTPEMVGLAKTRLDEVRQGNVYKIPFEDNRFELVCTREVLHLLPSPEKPVSEILRVLKPGGQFIVGQILPFGEDDAAWMYRIFKKKQPLIFNMFQEEDFRRLLSDAGFVDLEMKEILVWESIDVWIDSYETTPLHRHEIRQLFLNAPAEAKAIHPFQISPSGEIRDLWRWCVFSARKPG